MTLAPLQLEKTFAEAARLVERFRRAEGFRRYLAERRLLVTAAGAVLLATALGCAAALVVFVAELHPLLALPGLVLAPFVLLGSAFVQGYVLLSWLERRALERALRRRLPGIVAVPWGLAGLFVLLPLALLAAVSPAVAAVLLAAAALTPAAFARFDRP
ncbi:MAG TPA: hypothetical protein VM489_07290 [Burkholderiales bacterium]|nr:hypothetical protein [Burkholderiales bacterium]